MKIKQKLVSLENPDFKCKFCGSSNLWYYMDETFDGAYDRYNYHCHDCNKEWRVVDECD